MNWGTIVDSVLLIAAILNLCFGIVEDIRKNREKVTRHLLWTITLLMLRAVWLEEVLIAP